MDAANPSLTQQDLTSISDFDLIRTYCADHGRSELAQALWQRYEPTVHRVLHQLVFSGTLCPVGWDRQSFYESCLSHAYLNFLAYVCRTQIHTSVGGWFRAVAESAAFQERRDITRKRKPDKKQAEKQESGGTPYPGPREVPAGDAKDVERLLFRSEYLSESWQFGRADTLVAAKERKRIVLRVLILHAHQSDEGMTSARSLRLRYWRDWSYAQIGAGLYGPPWSDRERNRHEVEVRRLLVDDLIKLRVLLRESFGISELRHI